MNTRIFTTFLPFLALTATACLGEAEALRANDTTPPEESSGLRVAGFAELRVVHASPDAPRVDIYAEGLAEPLIKGIAFGETSTFLTLPANTYNIQLRASPSTVASPVAFSTGPLALGGNSKITAIASGLLGSTDAKDAFRVLPLAEKFAQGSSDARVRIVHASADAPTVGIDVGNDNPAEPEIAALDRFADTGGEGVSLPTDVALQVGITAGGARVTAFTTPALPAGAEVFVIATGLLSRQPREASGFALLAVGPSGTIGFIKQNPKFFALHGVQGLGSVDIFAGSSKLISDLRPNGLSAGVQLPPGNYNVDIFEASLEAGPPALRSPLARLSTGLLTAGQKYLAVASGIAARGYSSPVVLSAYAEGFDLSSAAQSKSLVRAVHTAPGVGPVDIGTSTATAIISPLVRGLDYLRSTAAVGLQLEPGDYRLGLARPNPFVAPFLGAYDFTLPSGGRSFVVVTGTLQQPAGALFPRPFVVDTTQAEWTISTPARVATVPSSH